MNRMRGFALIVAAQVALLLGWAGYHEWNRGTAPTILLETMPVDPRDLLRGDYMILSYKISRVPVPVGSTAETYAGRELWVMLRSNGRFHEVTGTSWSRPEDLDPETVLVRGRTQERAENGSVRLGYGIEKFFVPEGQGTPTFKEMIIEATVSPRHELGIKRLLLDGQPYPK
jgi:uncharacterized membrane-anchored protein